MEILEKDGGIYSEVGFGSRWRVFVSQLIIGLTCCRNRRPRIILSFPRRVTNSLPMKIRLSTGIQRMQ